MKWFWERGYYDSIDRLMDRLNDPRFRPVEDFVVLFHNQDGGYMVAFKYRRKR